MSLQDVIKYFETLEQVISYVGKAMKMASGGDDDKKKGKKKKKPAVAINLVVIGTITITTSPLGEAEGPPISLEKTIMAANCASILVAT